MAAIVSRRPSRQCGSVGAPFSLRSTEYAGRGAGRPSSAVVIRRTRVSRPASSKIASAKSAQVAVALGGDVVDAVREEHDLARRRREVPDVGRRAALVVDDRDLVPLLAEPEHRADEVRARRAEEPRRADDPGPFAGGRLAVQLRPPVRGLRVRPVRLHVRLALASVEDVVGRVVDERRAEGGDVRGAADVDRGRALRIVLGAVDVRPGGRVEDDVGLLEAAGSGSSTSQSARASATTPSAANSSASARPSCPPAPVTRYTPAGPARRGAGCPCSRGA